MNRFRILSSVIGFLALTACTSYYQITDPTSGKIYYSTSYEQGNGGTSFTDARTGNKVTIQNSEVAKITQTQFENGKNGVSTTLP